MLSLLKEVGRGKRGARDLAYEEAKRAAEMIFSGESTPAQTGAFLVAERIKSESTEELLAFVEVLSSLSIHHPIKGGIDCAGPYDGRTHSFLATLPTAFVLAACGLPVTLHGAETLPPKQGVSLMDVLRLLGANFDRKALLAGARKTGFLFVPSEDWCKPLAALRPIRQELGLRTLLNTAEKLIRYTDAPYLALGVYHGTFFEKMAEVLARLGVTSGIIVQGMEGSEDLPVDKRTRLYHVRDGTHTLHVIDPELLDVHSEMPAETAWSAMNQARMTAAVLRGEGELWQTHTVVLNCAVRLWMTDSVGSIEEGLNLASSTLYKGIALKRFEDWQDAMHG